ncbi:helix-turn-helix transcriptional regulator [Burkholderia ubonensis]|uniref:helix-turn-helix transcriptional regulator n=1 Tax=Burkholderia ubonensis TaxID=101571 RepID=UPI0009B31B4E|nr:hypothetical protein [Burkholderia ubonensis]
MHSSTTNARPALGQLPEHGYVRINQLVPDVFPVSEATFRRRVKEGAASGFPQPVKLGGGRAVFFRVEDVREFIAKHAAHAAGV